LEQKEVLRVSYSIVANWKCHKSTEDGLRWFDRFAELYRPHPQLRVVVAPPMVSLESLAGHLRDLRLPGVMLAAQDVSPFPRGGYTGAIAADMVRGLAHYVIVGHSERRRYFHETPQEIVNKASEAVDCGLTPIVCVEQESALSQLLPLADFDGDALLIAYTPVDALNFRIPESPQRVAEAVRQIARLYPRWPIIYGGALTVGNVGDYLEMEALRGVFLGAASLDADTFADICQRASASL
jgi:triosephosphate isomerase